MKKILFVSLIFVLTFGFITPLFAADNAAQKLARGAGNVLTSIFEIPKQIDTEWKASNNAAIGISAGLVKGALYTIGRIVSGTYDILTFPIDSPKNYEPLMKPDFVFDDYLLDK
ncbi:MAG: exosortase system-associated protein, TIGR04073 family [Candidatus Omnitrophota bacterium]